MTTLLISDIFPPKTGGSGRWFWEIARRLARENFCIAAGEDPGQEAFDRTHNLRLTRVPLTMPSRTVTQLGDLKSYCRAFKALRALIHAEGTSTISCGRCLPEGLIGLALKWWTGIPYTVFVHGEEVNLTGIESSSRTPGSGGMMESRQYRWLTKQVLRGAEYLIANSRNTQNVLTRDWRIPDERVRLLHPGVDTRQFKPAPSNWSVRNHLGWHERPVVLTVSRLHKRKGHDRMIRALPAIRRRIPNVLYAIVGDGEERSALERLTAEMGLNQQVQFLGETDERTLVECYQQCDVFVLPNRQIGTDVEGFGMVLLEAQACGKPVIAGNTGGTAETMRIPETGWVVPCEDSSDLAEAVACLLADTSRRDRMGTAARQWVVENFDWEPLSRQAAEWFGASATGSHPQEVFANAA